MSNRKYQPLYVAYARTHGNSPEAMLEHDRERWPGGKMCGYLLWIRERLQTWAEVAKHPRAKDANAPMWEEDIQAFRNWVIDESQLPKGCEG